MKIFTNDVPCEYYSEIQFHIDMLFRGQFYLLSFDFNL